MSPTTHYFTTFLLLFCLFSSSAQTSPATIDTTRQLKLEQLRQSFWDQLPAPRGWVSDFEQLFSSQEVRILDSLIGSFQERTSIEMAVVTIDSMVVARPHFDDLTLHMCHSWGIGQPGKDNGILIGISRGHRKMRIQNGYGIVQLISDEETQEIVTTAFIPGYKAGQYYEGTLNGLMKLMELLQIKLK